MSDLRPLVIAKGKSATTNDYPSKETTWPNLVAELRRLREKRAGVTFAQYNKLTKAEQDKKKNSAAFVGGSFTRGVRGGKNVEFRSLVTLDIDHAKMESWTAFKDLYGHAAFIYSTFSHTTGTPKLRLVMPLDRDVSALEYEPIARRVAEWWGIEEMDITTYQASRLMFWPFCPSDAEAFCDECEGEWLCADDILATYDDWTYVPGYPRSRREAERRGNKGAKLADPRDKPLGSSVGVFCRLWNIVDAIERFLPEVYVRCEGSNDLRYTFTGGSKKGGLVIYGADDDGEPMYAFSNHESDPVTLYGGGNGGSEVNAFDLVRLHLFGHLDVDKKDGTRDDYSKSYTAMQEMLINDKEYKLALLREKREAEAERLAAAREEFSREAFDGGDEFAILVGSDPAVKRKRPVKSVGADLAKAEEDDSWMVLLVTDKHGKCENTIHNAKVLLENLPELKGLFAYNEFNNTVQLLRMPPWEEVEGGVSADKWKPRAFEGPDMAALRLILEGAGVTNKDKINDAFCIVYMQQKVNPVRAFFVECGLAWDGVRRNEMILQEWLDAEDTELTRAMMRKTLIGMVKRVMEPGCKFDTSLTLVGGEDAGKSLLLARLCLKDHAQDFGAFNDSFCYDMIGKKEAVEQVIGSLGVECGEMVGIDRKDAPTIKHFLTIREDKVRLPWGEGTKLYKRQCIFFNTGNKVDFLRGNDGNRRYWVVELSTATDDESVKRRKAMGNRIYREFRGELINQIIGEAVADYWAGEETVLGLELELEARKGQIRHAETSPIIDQMAAYLDTLLPEEWSARSKGERIGYFGNMADELREEGVEQRVAVSFTEWWLEGLQRGNAPIRPFDREAFRGACKQLGWIERIARHPHNMGVYGHQRIVFDRPIS